jgi:hypothetical protein
MSRAIEKIAFHFTIATQHCAISDEVRTRMQPQLDQIRDSVLQFPGARFELVVVRHPREERFHARAKLALPGYTIMSGHKTDSLEGAIWGCLRRVQRRVDAYRNDPDRIATERAQRLNEATTEVIVPTEPDAGKLGDAFERDDYAAFRWALMDHEEWVRKRLGRWVQRYPEIDQEIGRTFEIADFVEEVFLLAFERYGERSKDVAIHEWLETLFDPAVQALARDPDERDAVRFVQSASDLGPPGGERH